MGALRCSQNKSVGLIPEESDLDFRLKRLYGSESERRSMRPLMPAVVACSDWDKGLDRDVKLRLRPRPRREYVRIGGALALNLRPRFGDDSSPNIMEWWTSADFLMCRAGMNFDGT